MPMNQKELALAAKFLSDYSDRLGNDTCNDWKFPDDWTDAERMTFIWEFHQANGDPQEFNPAHKHIDNSAVAFLLARKISAVEMPLTEQQARDRIAQLRADRAWTAAYVAGDTAKAAEMNRLHSIAFGTQPY